MGERVDIRQTAQGRWRSILTALGLSERALSGKHTACPMCGGTDRFRFDDLEGRGTYFCSGCGAGDGVHLAMGVTGQPFKEVANAINRLAGVVQPAAPAAERTDATKLAALRAAFKASSPIARGDEAFEYLINRGLKMADLPHSIRTHPGLMYHDTDGNRGPYVAMLAVVTSAAGQPVSIHRTYLDQARKAPVTSPKKLMSGLPIAGAAIRLTPISRTLGIAEGIETAWACFEQFEIPTWSCISANGLESFEPPAGVEHVVVFADHDQNFTGQAAAYRAAHRLAMKGYEVEVCVPPDPGDWLDHMPHDLPAGAMRSKLLLACLHQG